MNPCPGDEASRHTGGLMGENAGHLFQRTGRRAHLAQGLHLLHLLVIVLVYRLYDRARGGTQEQPGGLVHRWG